MTPRDKALQLDNITLSRLHIEGIDAIRGGLDRSECPYDSDTGESYVWLMGYDEEVA